MGWFSKLKKAHENFRVSDNVFVILENVKTGRKRSVSSHNATLNYSKTALSKWISGVNNTGYQAVLAPTQIELGGGSGTPGTGDSGLFSAYSNSITDMSYVTANSPSNGVTTFQFQIPAGVVTSLVTEALLRDANGNPWFHTMFGTTFTPSVDENITIQWQVTFS